MKPLFVTLISVLISMSAISQDIRYRKTDQPQNKEGDYDYYQINPFNKVNIIRGVLDMADIRIFDIPISSVFGNEYTFSVKLDEYVDGKKINSKEIFKENNIYKNLTEQTNNRIPTLTVFSKDDSTAVFLKIGLLGGETRETKLKKNIVRKDQYYFWRAYAKIDWKLNEELPLLVYASSWYDERIKQDRFCGPMELFGDKKELELSPHYYVISLKIFK